MYFFIKFNKFNTLNSNILTFILQKIRSILYPGQCDKGFLETHLLSNDYDEKTYFCSLFESDSRF
jgi:hypothetical protein